MAVIVRWNAEAAREQTVGRSELLIRWYSLSISRFRAWKSEVKTLERSLLPAGEPLRAVSAVSVRDWRVDAWRASSTARRRLLASLHEPGDTNWENGARLLRWYRSAGVQRLTEKVTIPAIRYVISYSALWRAVKNSIQPRVGAVGGSKLQRRAPTTRKQSMIGRLKWILDTWRIPDKNNLPDVSTLSCVSIFFFFPPPHPPTIWGSVDKKRAGA